MNSTPKSVIGEIRMEILFIAKAFSSRWQSAIIACLLAAAALTTSGCSFFISYTNSPDHFRRISTSDQTNPAVSDVYNDIDTGSEVSIIINDNAIIISDDSLIIVNIPEDTSREDLPVKLKD